MTARDQRLAELITARDRLAGQINRITGPAPVPPIWHPPAPRIPNDADRADVARGLVWAGWTHAQVAANLGIAADGVARLIAPAKVASVAA